MFENAAQFFREVRVELSKVTWPAWKPISPKTELWASTLVVIVTVALLAAFIGIVDRLLTIILSLVLGS
ncbi:MAG: preprotein translocase subunit SecE [bacterium]